MITIFVLIKKLPHMTDEQFHAHWRHPHGTLTRRIPQICVYVQNHGIGAKPSLPGLESSAHLGVPAIKVGQLSDLGAMFLEPDYKPLQDDALVLYDQNDVVWLVTQEKTWRRPQELENVRSPLNALLFLRRSAGCPAAQFAPRVVQMAASLCDAASDPCGCRVSLPAFDYYAGKEAPPFDAVVEILYPDMAAFERNWNAPASQALIAAALRDFLQASGTRGILTRQERII